ncbi:MAG: N-formylglutamate amidohydrolase [Alphaproteobacteria bacterium]|nr:MAG: N-formylglutamate amidohydrolase [Alphaproteobacteria bacterium]
MPQRPVEFSCSVPQPQPSLRRIDPDILRPQGRGGVLILCEHASNHVPGELDGLGLAPALLERHIAHDIGAAAVAQRLSALLDAPAVLARVSRLVIDVNRAPAAPDLIPVRSDGVEIPGNRALPAAARQARLDAFFAPFHEAAAALLEAMLRRGERPAVIGIHSFTPRMNGAFRPWHVGFLHNRDGRLFRLLRDRLRARWDLEIGDNEPYSGRDLYYSMHRHGEARGLLQTVIEIRQDLVTATEGQEEWAERLALCLREAGVARNARDDSRTD